MTTEDQLEHYLRERAAQIDLPAPIPGEVTRRARQRRRRRGALTAGVAASALVLGAVVFTNGSGTDPQDVGTHATEPMDPELEWTTVASQAGTGWGSPAVLDDSGAVYRLSTAPGELAGGYEPEPRRLYRSDDGTDWTEVGLPADLWASGLAARGDQVYAVGTSPSGGDLASLDLARSTADGWDVEQLPLDLEALSGSLPASSLSVMAPQVAVVGDTTVVAVNVVAPITTLADVLPEGTDPYAANVTPGGIETFDYSACEELQSSDTRLEEGFVSDGGPIDSDELATFMEEHAAEGGWAEPVCEPDVTRRGWDELGIDETGARALQGATLVFADDGHGVFEQVAAMEAGSPISGLVADDEGVWLVRTRHATGFGGSVGAAAELLHSSDGLSWDISALVEVPGHLRAAGLLDGQATVAVVEEPERVDLEAFDPGELRLYRMSGGAAHAIDTTSLQELAGDRFHSDVAFGPLGVAVVASGPDGRGVVYSPNGIDWSSHELPEAPDGMMESVNGLIVTADAVKVRLNAYPEGDLSGSGPLSQRLEVGTPKG